MKLLVIGNGAHEHALAWKIQQSPRVKEIYAVPGNAGTASVAQNINISSNDIPSIAKKATELKVDLVVVGPEAPLAAGLVDQLQAMKIPVFGPSKAAAQLESSKVFSRDLMNRYGIPCAQGMSFEDILPAQAHIETRLTFPVVVKADGLAAGKGVIIANTKKEALDALLSIMGNKIFGNAGNKVIIEEFLQGKEVSLLAFTDGVTAVPMVPACDYKRVFTMTKDRIQAEWAAIVPRASSGPI